MYARSKYLVKRDAGDVFTRQPQKYNGTFDFDISIDDEKRKEQLEELFSEFIVPLTDKALMGIAKVMKQLKIIFTLACAVISLSLFGQSTSKNQPFPIERSISNIFLEEPNTTIKILGSTIWEKHFEADGMFPRIECLNNNGTEGLRLFFFYGGTKNAVAEFEIFSIDDKYKKPIRAVQLDIDKFKSGKGIYLGLMKEEVLGLLGKGFKSTKYKDEEHIVYYTDDQASEVLKIYNGVAYFIKCYFIKGRLVKYNFGFEYP